VIFVRLTLRCVLGRVRKLVERGKYREIWALSG
jgi:hypothetical protein